MLDIKNKPKINLKRRENFYITEKLINDRLINTICISAKCPNKIECWSKGTATFLILGDVCSRNCKFCSVNNGKPLKENEEEIKNIIEAVKVLNLKYVIITSVSRDDLPDYGAFFWNKCIKEIKKYCPDIKIEALIPDFYGRKDLLDIIIEAKPFVIGHNVETVKRLTSIIRDKADYNRSLNVLRYVSKKGFLTKSGIMIGLGEEREEIFQTIKDIYETGCRLLTIGQYLQSNLSNLKVVKYYTLEDFDTFKKYALNLGFLFVESSPLVRSSYNAENVLNII